MFFLKILNHLLNFSINDVLKGYTAYKNRYKHSVFYILTLNLNEFN